MKMDGQKSSVIDKRRRPVGVVISALVTLTLLLGACGGDTDDNGGADNAGGEATVAAVGQTPSGASQDQNATETAGATTESGAVGESEQTTGTTGTGNGTSTSSATPDQVTVITSTNLITGTQVTTDVNVTTDTAVIAEQLITTVITMTDVVSNVNQTSDTSTSSESAIITATAEVSPESSSGEAIANVNVTPLSPTPSPTVVVEVTAVVTSTRVVTDSVEVTAVATPKAGQTPQARQTPQAQGATTGVAANGAGVVDIGNRSILASTLLDTDFHTSDGQVTGEVQDIVIDRQTGQVLYLMLEYGGVLDVGDVDLPAPLKAFTWGDDDQLVLNVEGDRISNFEGVGNDWPAAQDGTWDTDVRNFWKDAGFDVDFDAAQTGSEFARVSNITGNALGDAGFDNANVEDLIIDLGQGRASYVLLSSAVGAGTGTGTGAVTNTNATAGIDDGWLIVPFGAFVRTDNGLGVNPQFDAGLLEQAPRFNAPDFGDVRLFDENFDQEWRSFWEKAGFPVGVQGG